VGVSSGRFRSQVVWEPFPSSPAPKKRKGHRLIPLHSLSDISERLDVDISQRPTEKLVATKFSGMTVCE
jgi:hypothetical protein